MIVGKHAWQQEEEQKGDISTALMIQEKLFISELSKDIQDATLLILFTGQCGHSKRILPTYYHIGCASNLHSIINNGLIFFLPIDPRDKGHKDPEKIDLNVPRRAQYLHGAWEKHQGAVYWVDIDLAIRKGLTSRMQKERRAPQLLSDSEVFTIPQKGGEGPDFLRFINLLDCVGKMIFGGWLELIEDPYRHWQFGFVRNRGVTDSFIRWPSRSVLQRQGGA